MHEVHVLRAGSCVVFFPHVCGLNAAPAAKIVGGILATEGTFYQIRKWGEWKC